MSPPAKVCVVDDDAAVLRALTRLCRSARYLVDSFASGEGALEGMSAETACVVSDLMMPGIGGFDFLQQLRRQHPDLPLIILTASDKPEAREQALELGASAYFRKPVDGSALLDAIAFAISTHRPPPSESSSPANS